MTTSIKVAERRCLVLDVARISYYKGLIFDNTSKKTKIQGSLMILLVGSNILPIISLGKSSPIEKVIHISEPSKNYYQRHKGNMYYHFRIKKDNKLAQMLISDDLYVFEDENVKAMKMLKRFIKI